MRRDYTVTILNSFDWFRSRQAPVELGQKRIWRIQSQAETQYSSRGLASTFLKWKVESPCLAEGVDYDHLGFLPIEVPKSSLKKFLAIRTGSDVLTFSKELGPLGVAPKMCFWKGNTGRSQLGEPVQAWLYEVARLTSLIQLFKWSSGPERNAKFITDFVATSEFRGGKFLPLLAWDEEDDTGPIGSKQIYWPAIPSFGKSSSRASRLASPKEIHVHYATIYRPSDEGGSVGLDCSLFDGLLRGQDHPMVWAERFVLKILSRRLEAELAVEFSTDEQPVCFIRPRTLLGFFWLLTYFECMGERNKLSRQVMCVVCGRLVTDGSTNSSKRTCGDACRKVLSRHGIEKGSKLAKRKIKRGDRLRAPLDKALDLLIARRGTSEGHQLAIQAIVDAYPEVFSEGWEQRIYSSKPPADP